MSVSHCQIADFQNCQRFVMMNSILTPSAPIEAKFQNGTNGLVRED
jgi:hypothetical protein